nr:beta-propeller fold lactonase family protein [Microvirga makkahensis]
MVTVRSPVCFAYVGSRTTRERKARGNGLNVYRVDTATGVWTRVQEVTGLYNPSFLALDHSRRFLYCVHGDTSEISTFRIDPGSRFIVAANHVTSSLALLPRQADGSLGELIDLVVFKGEIGPHRVGQPFAKPHQVEFEPTGRFIAVPDKGLDRVFSFRLNEEKGRLLAVDAPPAPAREGAGPRRIAFHPTNGIGYVVNELDATVTAYRLDLEHGGLTPLQVLSTLSDTFVGHSRAAEIAVSMDRRFVYASNRGTTASPSSVSTKSRAG